MDRCLKLSYKLSVDSSVKMASSLLPQRLYQVLLLIYVWTIAKGELYTALVDLEKILVAESGVATNLREYIVKEESRLDQLRQ